MGTVDQTMPALFATAGEASDTTFVPLAQLGAGPDGVCVLGKRGEKLVEVHQLSFDTKTSRWHGLEQRIRAIGAIDHPALRPVIALEKSPPTVVLEGDSFPPLAELIEQSSVDMVRALRILLELVRAMSSAHHVGLVHGRLHPWSVWVGSGDRPRFELTGLATRPSAHPWAARCRSPEIEDGFAAPDPAADVFAIGTLLKLFTTEAGRVADDTIANVIRMTTVPDPDARPSMAELLRELHAAAVGRNGRPTLQDEEEHRPPRPAIGARVGRYELTKQLGVGAMGEVWEARDRAGDNAVAIKLLKPEIASDAELLRRFRKEARVLAKVGSPYIANFIDLNEDRGLHYLVLELVVGGSVGGALRRLGKIPERLALSIMGDVCRALAEPHRLGIVHRDLKPDNMMFVRQGIEMESNPVGQIVKLGDFGIARIAEDAAHAKAEGATREGAVLGTPEYMAPEQCQGGQVTPATDVYAVGCCLFTLISGRPPFPVADDNPMAVILQHMRDEPPRLDALASEVSPAVADLVAKCLEKDPKQRPADAAELLDAVDRMCNGEAALITAHPAPPVHRESRIIEYSFEWELQSTPEQLWPFVSNTEKMNRATGLPPVKFEIESIKNDTRIPSSPNTTGIQRIAGVRLQWKEHPYEWIEGSRHVVLRVFNSGLVRWYVAEVQLERVAGGTRLRNTVRIEPRSWLAKIISKIQTGIIYKRNLDRVYRRLDRILSAGPAPGIDPIEPEVELTSAARERLQTATQKLLAAGAAPAAVEALVQYLSTASDQDVARLRPLELASKFGVPEEAMIETALHAAKQGVLGMVWDVICPSCRIPSSVVESLAKIEEHARCKTCNVGFDVDFSRAIELAFRAAPDVRDVETQTFCIGGPGHFPHVAAQVRLAPNERFALSLSLSPGYYVIRSAQLSRSHEVRVTAQGGVRRVDIALGQPSDVVLLTAGDQLFTLQNTENREIIVRVERAGDRAFALTAARVMATASFRELFPDQSLAPGRLMAVTQATLVVAQIDDAQRMFEELGDNKAFPVAARFFEVCANLAREYGGSLVKTFGGLAISAFERPGPGVEAALALQSAIDADPVTSGIRLRVAVHRGPMMALTQAGRLDYFGQNVELALAASSGTPPTGVGITQPVCQDVAVAERVKALPDQIGMQSFGASSWVLHVSAKRSAARALPAPPPPLSSAATMMQ
ncbi:MAG: protein kinase domain-containing protein [Kofleriaceae bacterium]